MNEREYLKSIKFRPFLRRELSFLASSVLISGYTKELREAIGFSFKNVCYLSDGRLSDSLRTENELKQYSLVVKKIIINQPQQCLKLLNQGLNINQQAIKLIKKERDYQSYSDKRLDEELNKLINIYIKLFVFATIIPFEMSAIFNHLKSKGKINDKLGLEKKINKLRQESYYANYEELVMGRLFKEIAKRRKIKNYRILFNLKPEEISALILRQTDIVQNDLKTSQPYINLITPKLSFTKSGELIYKKYCRLLLPKTISQSKSLTGSSAYPGKVRGIVRILINRADLAKFKKAEILVTINSNPEYISAIKKSKAIVSDEGGLACHASIISRELKIPCIAGTKHATQILKTGDFIEVDANTGIINILKRSRENEKHRP